MERLGFALRVPIVVAIKLGLRIGSNMLPTPIWTDHAVISDAIISLPHPANARSHQLYKSHVWRARAHNRPAYRPGTRSLASVNFPAPAPGAGSGKLPSTT